MCKSVNKIYKVTMITEDYVSFEIAKLLKEKGFDEKCRQYYYRDNLILSRNEVCNEELDNFQEVGEGWSAPTLQMAMKWLREVHKLCISITPQVTDDEGSGGCLWEWTVTHLLVPQSVSLELFESYEEACEKAIRYCLENLI